ncbi:MAG: heme-binding protein [Actinomycetota bacterium]
MTIFGGGVGIFVDDDLVGAVGVSGGTPEQDAEVAAAGAAAVAVA